MSTDQAWRDWGAKDPYFAVITDERYRADRLTGDSLSQFFESGRQHVAHVLQLCRPYTGDGYRPPRVLDFGCGVGRVAIPFCRVAGQVVGVDISEDMLAEARRNAEAQGVGNLELCMSDDQLSTVPGTFDLVHSAIVLQHIPPQRGRYIFEALVAKLAPGGLGALQVTFGKAFHADNFGQVPPVEATPTKPGLRARLGLARASEAPREPATTDPEMQMHSYSLSELAFILQNAGVPRFQAEFTDHGGELGVFLSFQKPA